jgi:hypothetical protein
VASAAHSASVAEAIEATIDRETGALDASNQAAAEAQNAHGAVLQGEREQAIQAQKRAEAAFTDALKKLGLKLNLTKKSKTTAGNLIAKELSAAGISRAQIKNYTNALPG